MSQNHLPQLSHNRRYSMMHDLDKLRKIHEKRKIDWEKLDSKVKNRHELLRLNEESAFIREMWAFHEHGKELAKSIQDTSMFKERRKNTIALSLAKRLEDKFNYHFKSPKNRVKLSSIKLD